MDEIKTWNIGQTTYKVGITESDTAHCIATSTMEKEFLDKICALNGTPLKSCTIPQFSRHLM